MFAENLRYLREKKGLSQKRLGAKMYVSRSTIAHWENGTRLPDAAMILRLSKFLGTDANMLMQLAAQNDETPNIIMVDDSSIVLSDGLAVMEEVMPNAAITGFIWPQEAIEFARANRVELAILDIEMGKSSGLDLCRTLHEINPTTNVVFLTAYVDYSLDAWKTEASGFILKPMTPEGIREQLKKLRYPFSMGGLTDGHLDRPHYNASGGCARILQGNMPPLAAKIRRSKRQNEKSFGVYYIYELHLQPWFSFEGHDFLFAYRQKNNKLPMGVDRHLEECYIKYRQKHIIIANVRE